MTLRNLSTGSVGDMVLADISLPVVGLLFGGGIIAFFFLLGRFSGGNGADLVDWDPSGRAEQRRILDNEDTEQMLATTNRRRRAQGLPKLTEHEVLQGLQHRRDQL